MKKPMAILLIIAIMFAIAGCEVKGRLEIDRNLFVRAAGIDKLDEDEIRMTIISKKVRTEGKDNLQSEAIILTEEGRTLFETNRKFNAFSNKDIFWGHLEFFLIGEEAARDNIAKYLDFIVRDHEQRLTPTPIIVRGMTAEAFIKKINTKDSFIADHIKNIIESSDSSLSFGSKVSLVELVNMLDKDFTSAYLPSITLTKRGSGENGEQYDPKMDGYAAFKNNELIGFIQEGTARGLNWVLNKVESGYFIVKDQEGKDVSLEIISAKSKIKPEIKSDKLSAVIEIKMSSNISEYEGDNNIFDEENLNYLKKQQESMIREEVEAIISYAKENRVDLLKLGDAFYHKYPIKWEDEYRDNWENENFEKLPITVSIESKINRTYLFQEPIGSKEKLEK